MPTGPGGHHEDSHSLKSILMSKQIHDTEPANTEGGPDVTLHRSAKYVLEL